MEGACTREEKAEAKNRLEISPHTICVITVGTAEKFVPNRQYNFFKTAGKILNGSRI